MLRLLSIAITASFFLSACGGSSDEPSPSAPEESVALGSTAGASCVELYSLTTLTNRAFAFDGTVTNIEPPPPNNDPEILLLPKVTFEVHEWFRPEGPDIVTIEMGAPAQHALHGELDYAIGSRLLISGEPRWGGDPLDDPNAWICGFSRTHDAATADAWRDALN